jgi:hypothetical protein
MHTRYLAARAARRLCTSALHRAGSMHGLPFVRTTTTPNPQLRAGAEPPAEPCLMTAVFGGRAVHH